jgi:hypothetical protein
VEGQNKLVAWGNDSFEKRLLIGVWDGNIASVDGLKRDEAVTAFSLKQGAEQYGNMFQIGSAISRIDPPPKTNFARERHFISSGVIRARRHALYADSAGHRWVHLSSLQYDARELRGTFVDLEGWKISDFGHAHLLLHRQIY